MLLKPKLMTTFFIAMDKEQTIQNKKRSIRERRQERNQVETEEQKVERLRKEREQVSLTIKKAIIQVAGDGDMPAQETAHMLLSMPLTGCTYSFVTFL